MITPIRPPMITKNPANGTESGQAHLYPVTRMSGNGFSTIGSDQTYTDRYLDSLDTTRRNRYLEAFTPRHQLVNPLVTS